MLIGGGLPGRNSERLKTRRKYPDMAPMGKGLGLFPYLGIPGLCGPPGAPAAPVLKTRSPVPEPPAASTGRELSGAESLAEDPEALLF